MIPLNKSQIEISEISWSRDINNSEIEPIFFRKWSENYYDIEENFANNLLY